MKRSTKARLGLAGALLAPGLAGCGGSGSTPSAPLPRSASATLPTSGLTATVTEDRTSVKSGGVVTYTLTLTNNTDRAFTFQPVRRSAAPSAGVGDALTVKNADGGVTYPQGEFGQELTAGPNTTLAPGQSLSATEAVGLGNARGAFPAVGRYFASVTFTTQFGQEEVLLEDVTVGPLEVDAQ